MAKPLKFLIFLFLAISIMGCNKTTEKHDENEMEKHDENEMENQNIPLTNYEHLNIRKDKVIVKTRSNAEAKELSKKDIFLSDRPAYDIDVFVIATIDPSKTNLNDLLKIHGVIDAAYGMEYENVMHYPSNKIFIQLKKGLSVLDLDIDSESIELINPFDKIYLVTLNIKLDEVLNTCKYLSDSGICEFAEPSFLKEIKRMP